MNKAFGEKIRHKQLEVQSGTREQTSLQARSTKCGGRSEDCNLNNKFPETFLFDQKEEKGYGGEKNKLCEDKINTESLLLSLKQVKCFQMILVNSLIYLNIPIFFLW